MKRAHLLAGSHDTMTYCLNKKSSISHDQSWLLQLLDKVLPFITRPVVMKWSVTQVRVRGLRDWFLTSITPPWQVTSFLLGK